MTALTMPRPTLEALADATRTRLPWREPRTPDTHQAVPRLLVDALATFGAPDVLVDLDLAVRAGGQLRSWQRLRGDRVTAVSAAGPDLLELMWLDARHWDDQLARAATVTPPDVGPPPAPETEVPFELLVTGRAGHRLGRSAGRLRATVAGRRAVGLLSWVLYADGWRELTPYVDRGVPMVRVRAVAPGDLGARVTRLAQGARS
jgi:hypothetical protein